MIKKKSKFNPFLLEPAYKDYLWGGERLKDEFNKKTDITPLAETWECSTHPDGLSIVRSGKFEGKTLKEVIDANPEILGTDRKKDDLEILVKLIDAKKDLSIQVHPDDEYARTHENGSLGKSEMWYVLDALPGAKLIYGFKYDVYDKQIKRATQNGMLQDYLNKVDIKKGDTFFIDSGMVHAICSGALIAEIQESSNLTYRLYDYNRKDKNGNLRELHIDKALEVANKNSADKIKVPMSTTNYKKDVISESLVKCKYFEVTKDTINGSVSYLSDTFSYKVFLIIEGEGTARFDCDSLKLIKGDCMFIPADSPEITLEGDLTLLRINN